MPREWGRFWIAFAIMILAGAVVFSTVLKAPINVGSIGQWASALGTTSAVWVALRNTRRTLKDAAERDAAKQKLADRSYIAAICALSNQIDHAVRQMHAKAITVATTPAAASSMLHRTNIKGLVSALDRVPLHQAPDVFWIAVYDNVRTSGHNFAEKLETVVTSGKTDHINFVHEVKLLRDTITEIKDHLSANKIDVGEIF